MDRIPPRPPANTNATPPETVSYLGWPRWCVLIDIEINAAARREGR